ncbi:Ca-activated chloride channel family protein [Agreia bicolorata]|uniref:Ca-activated chloride channel family protein n=1 Tax=Agreia bicolorata TaxID=110935 RepID=A0A1T4XAN8_9MICO|nr:VWA domain-containing protein [Agreia bicolorata]SKA86185.1 Ca-activated chloride channel family protein [Agreia bicolorata]
MRFSPVLPWPALIAVFAVLAAFVVWQLLLRENRSRRLSWSVRAAMVVLLLLVALRPGIPGAAGEKVTTDVDVFFVVDTTTSVVAEDFDGSEPRLDGVKSDIVELVKAYPGARFALMSFDSSAVLRVPLTSDATAVANAAEVLAPEITIYSNGSSVTEAKELLASTLQRAQTAEPDRSRVVYYFGDGEQTSSAPVESFSDSAPFVSAGFVFGYGTEAGGQMRVQTGYYDDDKTDDGYVTDDTGSPARSVIDEKNLRTIADQLGAEYVHRTAPGDAPVTEVGSSATRSASNESSGGTTELYWIPAAALVLLLAFEAIMVVRRLRELRDAAVRHGGDE